MGLGGGRLPELGKQGALLHLQQQEVAPSCPQFREEERRKKPEKEEEEEEEGEEETETTVTVE